MNHSLKCYFSRIRVILLGLFIIINFAVNGQNGVPSFLSQTEWLEGSDSKKWTKQLNQLEEADKLLIQSNNTYLEASYIESDASLDESKKQKQIAKYEKQAANQYNQALTKYKDIYNELYKILNKYLGETEKSHQAYNEMLYNIDQSAQLYKENSKLETDTERDKFSQANELLLSSLEKGISIFSNPTQEHQTQSRYNTNVSTESDDIVFDNDLYQKYKAYTSDQSIADPIVISQLMLLEGDDAAFAAYEKKWAQYLSNEDITMSQKEEMGKQLLDSLIAEKNNPNSEVSNQELEQQNNSNASKSDNSTTSRNNNKTDIISSAIKATSARATFNVESEFRVQVAASKIQLTRFQLAAIYKGDLSLIEFKEGNYFKYQIRSFSLYIDAQKTISNSGVKNAYITAYTKSKSVSLANAVKENQKLKQEVEKYGRQRVLKPIDFAIQIAASRNRLSANQINHIYSGSEIITTVFEENWYKYQILAGNNLQNAFNILENCNVKKAFLVAYKNGRKIKLYKALNEYKTYNHE